MYFVDTIYFINLITKLNFVSASSYFVYKSGVLCDESQFCRQKPILSGPEFICLHNV